MPGGLGSTGQGRSGIRDIAEASVFELHTSGGNTDDDWSEADTLDLYIDLHPGADRAALQAELTAALAAPLAGPPTFSTSRRRAAVTKDEEGGPASQSAPRV